jgi:6-phosphofructokinase 1
MSTLIAHGGGPTAVLNASLAGVIDAWQGPAPLIGARFGIDGIVKEDFVPLETVQDLKDSPGSALGSSRRRLTDEDFARILEIFRRRGIHHFFYTGGNGSMDTALRLSQLDPDLQVIGIPKTIDNDLAETDHTPGYPSAARFFIHAARDAGEDNRSLPSPICVLEVLGRNTGWIAAATSLARYYPDDAPHLIYFPEQPVTLDQIAADVERVYARLGRCFLVVCEGQVDPDGNPFGADVDRPDSEVHHLASNLGHTLARLLTEKLGIRARAEKPGLVGRSSAALASDVDREESYSCGQAAVAAMNAGETGKMVTLHRISNVPYLCETGLRDLSCVARIERPVPAQWITAESNNVAGHFRDYLKPLIGEIRHWRRI